ncbi:nascent polypeptide-associated complex subunit beta [Tremella mesenterica]|uniref:Nascent polypeptide-associated complex subunit beta n=1 Tax=Tremella mesenterica TaxID=5217 RepID=A0A4V1M4X4_TREME|nr:uncharacterized protein TREMEDRAFT_72449 [Tremella mesenterica DSM 1558]EIW66167.1 hypothetical protein TREMEDRAFT_72449 [Tremella mesenterica DSM 1558]RXK41877.1 nascent polypeptide-associated complex subunit beta [Tremella mesenterica]
MDKEKLAKLQAQVRIGGKGTPRRKVVKKSATASQGDDRKVQAQLKKLNMSDLGKADEVNMFKEDGNVLHFSQPRVHASVNNNSLVVYGAGQTKELTELVPGVLNQLGPDSLANLRRLAESYQSMTARQAAAAAAAGGAGAGAGTEKEGEVDDDEIPELVEDFEAVGQKSADLETLE